MSTPAWRNLLRREYELGQHLAPGARTGQRSRGSIRPRLPPDEHRIGHGRHRGGLRLTGCERGQSLVEFALTLPFLLAMLLTALDVGRLFYTYIGLQDAAREAVAYAAASATCQAGGSTCADPQILAIARQEVGGDTTLLVDAVTCTTSCTRSSGLNEYRITVSLSRPFPLMPGTSTGPGLGGITFPIFTLGASATAVIQ